MYAFEKLIQLTGTISKKTHSFVSKIIIKIMIYYNIFRMPRR